MRPRGGPNKPLSAKALGEALGDVILDGTQFCVRVIPPEDVRRLVGEEQAVYNSELPAGGCNEDEQILVIRGDLPTDQKLVTLIELAISRDCASYFESEPISDELRWAIADSLAHIITENPGLIFRLIGN